MGDLQVKNEQQIKGGVRMKKIKNEKGFSLVELLIVIAIMGVLAVIAFNMFGGVLQGSKKSADAQQGKQIEKALLTYCIESSDWELTGQVSAGAIKSLTTDQLIIALTETITKGSIGYGPYISLKDPAKPITDDINKPIYTPQWNTSNGGLYVGYQIDVWPQKQTVVVVPSETLTKAAIHP